MNWFLYEGDIRHERVKNYCVKYNFEWKDFYYVFKINLILLDAHKMIKHTLKILQQIL